MGKKGRLLLLWVFLGACGLLALWIRAFEPKPLAYRMVMKDQEALAALAEEGLEAGTGGLSWPGVRSVCVYGDMVDFSLPSCFRYVGFYFSPEDAPRGFQNTSMALQQEGDAWTWREGSGDNHYYTERICPRWFFYQMWF